MVFVNSHHFSNEDHVELDLHKSLTMLVGDKHAVLCFCFLILRIKPSVFTPEFNVDQVNLPLVWIQFLVYSKLLKI